MVIVEATNDVINDGCNEQTGWLTGLGSTSGDWTWASTTGNGWTYDSTSGWTWATSSGWTGPTTVNPGVNWTTPDVDSVVSNANADLNALSDQAEQYRNGLSDIADQGMSDASDLADDLSSEFDNLFGKKRRKRSTDSDSDFCKQHENNQVY